MSLFLQVLCAFFLLVPLSLYLQGPVINGSEEINKDIIEDYTIIFFL